MTGLTLAHCIQSCGHVGQALANCIHMMLGL